MRVSVVEVHQKLDVVVDEIRREGAHTREAIQQTVLSLGKFLDVLSSHFSNIINVGY